MRIVSSPSAAARVARASEWLTEQGAATELVIVGATLEAAADLARTVGASLGGSFGWHRLTLLQLAWALARTSLAQRGLVPVGSLALAALSARVVHAASRRGALGRFAPIESRPGLPRALATTFTELRLSNVEARALADAELADLAGDYEEALLREQLADRAELLRAATTSALGSHALLGKPLLFLDVPVATACERDFVAGVASRSSDALFTVPKGDARTLLHLDALANVSHEEPASASPVTPLVRIQTDLFAETTSFPPPLREETALVFSAPGESRECMEIARRIHQAAERGVPFDRMAVLLRSPTQYRPHLEEAFRRASIPAHFARGSARPDPSGRAFLALLACASEGLSASRFAEYLSIGEVPHATKAGAPPPAESAAARWVPRDDELATSGTETEPLDAARIAPSPGETGEPSVIDGTLRAPRLWERLLVEAAVIGGVDRWERRLEGLVKELDLKLGELDDPSDATAAGIRKSQSALAGLRAYALPLIVEVASWPTATSWGDWLERLGALATRALAQPARVLAVLGELMPMAEVEPVELSEVRFVLERRLTDIVVAPSHRRFGRVYIAAADEARGLVFDLVFVPGLAEKLFPRKISEDPILPDRARAGTELVTNADRGRAERLALRIAVGAAREEVVLSYPRLDLDQARPRTPSFYGLEVLRAAEGELPDFDALARRADAAGSAHVGWPAPKDPMHAVDDAEHDLALLESVLRKPDAETVGTAHYLLSSNVHLARALRARWNRWSTRKWTSADGLVSPAPAAEIALAAHALAMRSYSPTGLQNYAACPYRFLLQAIHRLSPREEVQPVEELDPLQRGSLIHKVQFELGAALRERHLLPVTPETLDDARGHLEVVLERVVAEFRERLCPAIDRVWDDGVARVKADLREWLRRATEDPSWTPEFFELAFGLSDLDERDASSIAEPVPLDCGIRLRGSIDLVERGPGAVLRATDHKTGKQRAEDGVVIGHGEVLQPVLYALALEKLRPDSVLAGRLYYCTSVGDFSDVVVPLDVQAREAAVILAQAIGDSISRGFLPAAPVKGACEYCDYRAVCGPNEETRTARKQKDKLALLHALRSQP